MSTAEATTERATTEPPDAADVHARHETRNLCTLALQQILIRVGWIFKTESVIMPTFVDMIAGPGWVRGCLPVLNRLGQSIPQFLFADRLRSMPLKLRPLGWSAVLMGLPFLMLAGLLTVPGAVGSVWLPVVFLVLYLFFFSMTGLNQLSLGTITGKLISANRRGRLMAIAGVIGVTLSILAAWNLLPLWLGLPNGGFVWIFLFVGSGFVVAGTVVSLLVEQPDSYPPRNRETPFGDAWRRVQADRHLTRLLIVAALFVTSLLLVPHYQALARQGRLDFSELMIWVVSQNASAGVMALISGLVADRFGFRMSMRLLIFISGCCPLTAIVLARYADPEWFVLSFVMFGAIPNTFRAMENYCLELTTPSRHAQYISTLKLFMPVALLLSPLVGWLTDSVGFAPVFIAIGITNLLGFLLTFRIAEPRHWLRDDQNAGVDPT